MDNLELEYVLGKEGFDILKSQIYIIGDICKEINDIIDNQQEVGMFLNFVTFCPVRVDAVSSAIESIKNNLDIAYKHSTYSNDVIRVRNLLINLFSNLKELHNAIMNYNDVLIIKYNDNIKCLIKYII